MDNSSTFLELPLDRDLYTPKNHEVEKPPLRVLLPEAGTKIALNLLYKICSGEVFGCDQKLIIHLINNKGSVIQQRAYLLELDDCGFALVSEFMVSAEPAKSYGNVDYVISVAGFEALPGHPLCNSFLYQLNKTRNVVRNIRDFSKPETKLIICGPSTKGVVVLLTCIKIFEPDFPSENISGVTCLDEAISKALIAKELKTTTDRIKNVVIWGATFPDLAIATVLTRPQDDLACLEEVEMSVMDVLQDHNWIYTTLIPNIYKRVLRGNLAKHGMAVASAAAKHVKTLLEGTRENEEIISMATITPDTEPYGLQGDLGLSFPIDAKDGVLRIREGIKFQTTTGLLLQKIIHRIHTDLSMITIYNMIEFMKEYEEKTGEQFLWTEHLNLIKKDKCSAQLLSYLISPNADEQIPIERVPESHRKSIIWDDSTEDTQKQEMLTKVNFRKRSKRQT